MQKQKQGEEWATGRRHWPVPIVLSSRHRIFARLTEICGALPARASFAKVTKSREDSTENTMVQFIVFRTERRVVRLQDAWILTIDYWHLSLSSLVIHLKNIKDFLLIDPQKILEVTLMTKVIRFNYAQTLKIPFIIIFQWIFIHYSTWLIERASLPCHYYPKCIPLMYKIIQKLQQFSKWRKMAANCCRRLSNQTFPMLSGEEFSKRFAVIGFSSDVMGCCCGCWSSCWIDCAGCGCRCAWSSPSDCKKLQQGLVVTCPSNPSSPAK